LHGRQSHKFTRDGDLLRDDLAGPEENWTDQ
jgi:hypothetical protein